MELSIDISPLQTALANLRANIQAGLPWDQIAFKAFDIIRLASAAVKRIESMSNDEKRAFATEWALKAYDVAVAVITAHVAAWWLVPVFGIARMALVYFLPGVIDWVYQVTVKPDVLPALPVAPQ